MTSYIVATIKPWNITAYERRTSSLPGTWMMVNAHEELTLELIEKIRPRFIFFPHWSWKVPDAILVACECVCFHMTDVPYGRGGSPLQNLIEHGHTDTKISALRMVDELDAGPVYLKRPLSLSGRAQVIFEKAAEIVFDMIEEIARDEPQATPQKGAPATFKRRTPDQSTLPTDGPLKAMYDHIRMLDAETYPNAFLEHGQFHISFSEAEYHDGKLEAKVSIIHRKVDKTP
ncbi:MAG: hypothetical protein NUV50_09560 [Rhodospirillales bacterium]|nr:hypothetical protein [Rhodospirillales bacterium]